MYHADPARSLTTSGEEADDLYHDLSVRRRKNQTTKQNNAKQNKQLSKQKAPATNIYLVYQEAKNSVNVYQLCISHFKEPKQ